MPLETACLAYAGLASIAATGRRFRRARPARLRIAGAALLLLSLAAAIARFGPAQGPVAWTGMLGLAGAALVLILSRWPRAAIGLAVPLAATAPLMIAFFP